MAASSSPGGSIYLDHAAATPLRPDVDEAMREAARTAFANASSPHAAGRLARRTLEEARERILAALSLPSTADYLLVRIDVGGDGAEAGRYLDDIRLDITRSEPLP